MMNKRARVIALVSGEGWHVQDLARAAGRVGVGFRSALFPTLEGRAGMGPSRPIVAAGAEGDIDLMSDADAVLVRMMPPGTLEQVVFRMDALHRLEQEGRVVLNPPRAVEAAVDKYLATARLDAAGLLVPPTWVGERPEAALDAFEGLGGDVVVKPLFGSEGRGLVRLTDIETAGRVFQALSRIGAVLYVQRFIPNDGTDVRAFVLDGRVIAAMRRRAPGGDWRANVARGGRAEAIALDDEARLLAAQAAETLGARMAGVDLIEEARTGRRLVLEVNAVPGWKALSAATGVDVASEILSHLAGERARP
jgi:ribosomal protein S6--L-glutamate ligase